jgi:hypothetical protein
MDNWCEAASDFAYWQETTKGLFYDSYIGPTAYYPSARSSYQSPSYDTSYQLPAIFGSKSQFFDAFGWMPSFAGEGYVASPTIAKIGDRPGGEYVIGAARFEAAAAKMGAGGGITVNYSPTINGAGLSADEVAAMLEKDHQKLIKEIAEASKGF